MRHHVLADNWQAPLHVTHGPGRDSRADEPRHLLVSSTSCSWPAPLRPTDAARASEQLHGQLCRPVALSRALEHGED